MKHTKFFAVVVLAAVSCLALNHALAKKGGTNILHYTVKTAMLADTLYDADATGRIDVKVRQQGGADQQSLHLRLAHLDTNATYTLEAQMVGDSNLTEVATFDTDSNGQADLNYANHGNSHGKGHGHSGGIPGAAQPLIDVLNLSVVNASTQTVLSANLQDASLLQYLVKHTMDNDGVEPSAFGVIRIKANNQQQQFSLQASGLSTNTDYWLVVNDDVVSTNTTDANGKLKIDSLPGGAPNVLDITSVALWNTTSNSVLSATIP